MKKYIFVYSEINAYSFSDTHLFYLHKINTLSKCSVIKNAEDYLNLYFYYDIMAM